MKCTKLFIKPCTPFFVKKGVLRKVFAKLTGKHLCHRLYFNKVAGLML